MVPNLITALEGPMNELEQRILESTPAIERWFRLEWMEHTPPFYSAVDIRNAGFKLAPVDTTLFPGGWNQLTPQMLPLAVQAAMAAIEKICPEARNLLIIPENHAQDPAHLASVAQLARIFHTAGLNVRVGIDRSRGEGGHDGHVAGRGKAHARTCGAQSGPPGNPLFRSRAPSCSIPTWQQARQASWRICTSSTCCHHCMPAGRCAAKVAIFRVMKR